LLATGKVRCSFVVKVARFRRCFPSLHADSDLRDSLVYDLVAPFCARLKSSLLGWVGGVKWRCSDFKVNQRGVVSLDDNLKRLVAERVGVVVGVGGARVNDRVDRGVRNYIKMLVRL